MKITIGNTLKSLRKKYRLSQEQVAEFLFISRPTYNRFEHAEGSFKNGGKVTSCPDHLPADLSNAIDQMNQAFI